MSSRVRTIAAVTVGALAATAWATTLFPQNPLAHDVFPPAPANEWDVSLIHANEFVRPQFPSIRTSADGRVGLIPKVDSMARFNLVIPELMAGPFQESPAGVNILTTATTIDQDPTVFHRSTLKGASVSHATLLDLGGITTGTLANPYYRNGHDLYDLVVVAFVSGSGTNGPSEIWTTPLHVEVANPKTAQASFALFQPGTPTLGQSFPTVQVFHEPMVTSDGRLLVVRVGSSQLTWKNSKGAQVTGKYNIVYAYNAGTPGDVSGWAQLYPICHAPYDGRLGAYGFADRKFRDMENNVLPEDMNLPATYPWIDRNGRNLFFYTISATNYFWDTSLLQVRARYPLTGLNGPSQNPTTDAEITNYDEPGNTRGLAVMGLWTNGKMVLLDGILNNIDFGTHSADSIQRLVELYSTGPLVRVGTGRENANPSGAPPLADDNSTIVDSAENSFNAEPAMSPRTPRDIVWLVNSGKASDEVIFDDFIDRNMFIFANMTVSASIDASGNFHPADGFRNDGKAAADFDQPVSVQNAATSPPELWNIPAAGNLEPTTPGTGRIEPVALGGTSGKGFYLAESSRLVFSVPTQPTDPTTYPWYAGVFVNPSFTDDGARREVLSFPDGTGIDVIGTSTLALHDAKDTVVVQYALSGLGLQSGQWTHLGFVVQPGGTDVTVVVNGFRWQRWTGATPLLQLTSLPGSITLGGRSGKKGISGWVDELKVAAESPMTELLANHARGTIVQLGSGYTGPLRALAQLYPAWAQNQIDSELGQTGQTYVAYTRYELELGASHREVPANTISVRSQLNFPEQQTNPNLPRNDSTKNQFCLTCHGAGGEKRETLTLFALQPGSLPEAQDPIRRPIQPPRLMYGLVPANFFGPGLPPAAVSKDAGIYVDDYLLGH